MVIYAGYETGVLGQKLDFRGYTCQATHPSMPKKDMNNGECQKKET
jgi:hypothetical protein